VVQGRDHTGGRIERIDPDTGETRVLYSHRGDIALSRPNDIVCDGQGGFWFTDLGKVRANEQDGGRVF
jgi:gluconolactonase